MKIDDKILERIREYYSDELSEADAEATEYLIGSDEQYALHNKLFRAAGKGIGEAVDGPKKAWMRELDRREWDDAEKNALENLKKSDRSGTRARRLAFAGLLLILLSLLGYVGWRQWGGSNSPMEQPATPETPIASESAAEEEEWVGSPGARVSREADVFVFSPESDIFEPAGSKRPVSIQRWPEPGLSYVFTGDTLLVFAENPEAFREAAIRWLEKADKLFLSLDGRVYELERGTSRRQPLEEVHKEVLLK